MKMCARSYFYDIFYNITWIDHSVDLPRVSGTTYYIDGRYNVFSNYIAIATRPWFHLFYSRGIRTHSVSYMDLLIQPFQFC